ncbi:tripartite tricarboxylate transporter substrate binding protein [Mesorhizobium sp. CAU 1732]|uniref:Bug family tripartite tricarboxylate transporter substrate binding protein n=1 Tax=Mesorhizobium sp. CAU 1732 TaxID=3140358 RepID=UPI003260063E
MKHLPNCMRAAVFATALFPAAAMAQEWTPDRPINIIVPWGAGGATDQVTRVTAPLLAEALGVEVVVVNQPGASGAIGTQEVLNSARDGYTLLATGIADAATYGVTGLIEGTTIDDWHLYLSVANVALVSVPADSPYDDFGALLEALRSDEGSKITVATAGISSAGGTAIANLAEIGGFNYNLVSYEGGGPATIATASGEAMVTTQLAGEQSELIRGKRLKPLAVLAEEPLIIDGVEPIPSVLKWLPDLKIAYNYFGVLAPKGLPAEVVNRLDTVWQENVATAPSLRNYAETAGAVYSPAWGDEARSMVSATVVAQACAAVERGNAVNDPSTIGVDCEARTETPVQ